MRAALVVLVVSGIAAAASGLAAAAAPAPCKLATTAQVRAAFGGSIGAGKVDSSVGDPMCRFAVSGSNLGQSGTVIVFPSPEQTAAMFAIAKRSVPGAVPVAGVGNGAFYNPHTSSIELIKGKTVATVQGLFLGASAAKVKADVIALARTVGKNL
jgi:hypothetical protein